MKISKQEKYKYPEIRKSITNKDFLYKLDKLGVYDKYIEKLLEEEDYDKYNVIKVIDRVVNRKDEFYNIIISSFDWGNTYKEIQFWSNIAKSYEDK